MHDVLINDRVQGARILFLAYYFPPMGGGGTQRSLKFVKYLPAHGFKPAVLAGEGVEGDRWAPPDAELCREIGKEIPICRVNIYQKNFEAPLRKRLRDFLGLRTQFGVRWMRSATGVGRKMCAEVRPNMIFATMSPFESAIVADVLSREFGIPWVADLRDPWALDEWIVYPTRWHRKIRLAEMSRQLRSASLIIMNTPEAAKRCRETFPKLAEIPIVSISNGYDAEDFKVDLKRVRNERFTVVHAGALHTARGLREKRRKKVYQLLGRMEEGVQVLARSHYYLVQAVEKWMLEDESIRNQLKFEFIGEPTPEDRAILKDSPMALCTEFTGYLSHSDSVRRVRLADLLFLPMQKLPKGRRATIVPGKTYEYMASGRPILAAVPEGDCRDFMKAVGTAEICEPDDIDGILSVLKRQYKLWQSGDTRSNWDENFVKQFRRESLTAALARELSELRTREDYGA